MIVQDSVKAKMMYLGDDRVYRLYLGDDMIFNCYVIVQHPIVHINADGMSSQDIQNISSNTEWNQEIN